MTVVGKTTGKDVPPQLAYFLCCWMSEEGVLQQAQILGVVLKHH